MRVEPTSNRPCVFNGRNFLRSHGTHDLIPAFPVRYRTPRLKASSKRAFSDGSLAFWILSVMISQNTRPTELGGKPPCAGASKLTRLSSISTKKNSGSIPSLSSSRSNSFTPPGALPYGNFLRSSRRRMVRRSASWRTLFTSPRACASAPWRRSEKDSTQFRPGLRGVRPVSAHNLH